MIFSQISETTDVARKLLEETASRSDAVFVCIVAMCICVFVLIVIGWLFSKLMEKHSRDHQEQMAKRDEQMADQRKLYHEQITGQRSDFKEALENVANRIEAPVNKLCSTIESTVISKIE